MRMARQLSVLICIATALGLSPGGGANASDAELPVLRIGILHSFVGENAGILNQAGPLTDILGSQLGVKLKLCAVADAPEMTRLLLAQELDLGVMHGIEYAWLRRQSPALKPVALAMNETIKLRALVIVPACDDAMTIADLKGSIALVPRKGLHHCPLYTHKLILDAELDPCGFFGGQCQCRNVDEVLDGLVDGKGRCAMIDGQAWSIYQERKPGRAKKLRVLAESGWFPTSAVVIKDGSMDEARITQIKEGFTSLHQKPLGRQMLMFWRLSQFVVVPPEYETLCQEVLREIPNALPDVSLFQNP
ncbi:MAG TPA: PhnD/SsuA/transferrin family substrate-binding protein [Gemmatales bacterium]|nr:PhnD/SsuA/transferrin family substrate-binding protein [Gemmatales bacterium]HMP58234.1 PhnD/SsuA/transferrin family substrate-binding protein [Gemmatales bacterium]